MDKIAVRECYSCGDQIGPLERFFAWYAPAVRKSRYWCTVCAEPHFAEDLQGDAVLIMLVRIDAGDDESPDGWTSAVKAERSEP